MVAAILNSAILNSVILDSAILHKTLTQTNSMWLKPIYSHSTWWSAILNSATLYSAILHKKKTSLVVSWYFLEHYIGFVVRQAFNYCCSLHQVRREAVKLSAYIGIGSLRSVKTVKPKSNWKLRSIKSVKPNGNWKPKKFKSVKPNWMEDVEGVKLLA